MAQRGCRECAHSPGVAARTTLGWSSEDCHGVGGSLVLLTSLYLFSCRCGPCRLLNSWRWRMKTQLMCSSSRQGEHVRLMGQSPLGLPQSWDRELWDASTLAEDADPNSSVSDSPYVVYATPDPCGDDATPRIGPMWNVLFAEVKDSCLFVLTFLPSLPPLLWGPGVLAPPAWDAFSTASSNHVNTPV